MAHAAPATPGPATRHPAHPARQRHTASTAALVLPALGGVVYGLWTSGIDRDAGPITGWNVLLGVVSALAFAGLAYGIHAIAPRLPRELRALTWAVFAGISFGFLHSLADTSVLKSAGLSLVIAASVFVAAIYHYCTREN
jgi:drug/metabolite transporter (DMT)-like permease